MHLNKYLCIFVHIFIHVKTSVGFSFFFVWVILCVLCIGIFHVILHVNPPPCFQFLHSCACNHSPDGGVPMSLIVSLLESALL